MNKDPKMCSGQYGDVNFTQWLQRGNLSFDEVWKNNTLHASLGRQFAEYQKAVQDVSNEYKIPASQVNLKNHEFVTPDPGYRRHEKKKAQEAFEKSSYKFN